MFQFEETTLRWIQAVVTGIEILAVIIIVIVIVTATVLFLSRRFLRKKPRDTYHEYRVGLARAILLGLEVLIAADVVRTVVLDLTFQSIAILGLLVIVRTFLSWSLLVEIDKRWPWQTIKNEKEKEET